MAWLDRIGLSLLTRSDTVTVVVAAYPTPGSVHFFMPDRDTSPHPLIIAAGMDGTGLLSLSRALSHLGRRVSLPAIDMTQCRNNKAAPSTCSPLLGQLDRHGLQAGHFNNTGDLGVSEEAVATPRLFEDTDVVMSHPVPHFTWDLLEAYPNAKVILTVRNANDFVATVQRLSPLTGTAVDVQRGASVVRGLVWNTHRSGVLPPLMIMRKYLEHNAKIIHGVPKHQLLVLDLYGGDGGGGGVADGSSSGEASGGSNLWEPLCAFLGVSDVPTVPFPGPTADEM